MDTFAQITIPLLILLALRIKTRKALLLLPFAILIDLDVFFRMHRLLFHNILVAFIIPLLFTYLIYKYKRDYFGYAWIAFFYIFSSLILDISNGVGLLYPISTDIYYFRAEMTIQMWNFIPFPDLNINYGIWAAKDTVVGEKLGAVETAQKYPSVSDTSTGFFFTLVVASLMYFRKSYTFLSEAYSLFIDILKWFKFKIIEISDVIK